MEILQYNDLDRAARDLDYCAMIRKIFPEACAALKDACTPGDVVVEVDGESCEGKSGGEIIQLVQRAFKRPFFPIKFVERLVPHSRVRQLVESQQHFERAERERRQKVEYDAKSQREQQAKLRRMKSEQEEQARRVAVEKEERFRQWAEDNPEEARKLKAEQEKQARKLEAEQQEKTRKRKAAQEEQFQKRKAAKIEKEQAELAAKVRLKKMEERVEIRRVYKVDKSLEPAVFKSIGEMLRIAVHRRHHVEAVAERMSAVCEDFLVTAMGVLIERLTSIAQADKHRHDIAASGGDVGTTAGLMQAGAAQMLTDQHGAASSSSSSKCGGGSGGGTLHDASISMNKDCSACFKSLGQDAFSKTQWGKGAKNGKGASRRCKECTGQGGDTGMARMRAYNSGTLEAALRHQKEAESRQEQAFSEAVASVCAGPSTGGCTMQITFAGVARAVKASLPGELATRALTEEVVKTTRCLDFASVCACRRYMSDVVECDESKVEETAAVFALVVAEYICSEVIGSAQLGSLYNVRDKKAAEIVQRTKDICNDKRCACRHDTFTAFLSQWTSATRKRRNRHDFEKDSAACCMLQLSSIAHTAADDSEVATLLGWLCNRDPDPSNIVKLGFVHPSLRGKKPFSLFHKWCLQFTSEEAAAAVAEQARQTRREQWDAERDAAAAALVETERMRVAATRPLTRDLLTPIVLDIMKSSDLEALNWKIMKQQLSAKVGRDVGPAKELIKEITKEAAFYIANSTESGWFDLECFNSTNELLALGPDQLATVLLAEGLKCGGTLEQKASRLLAIKGLPRDKIPKRLRWAKRRERAVRNPGTGQARRHASQPGRAAESKAVPWGCPKFMCGQHNVALQDTCIKCGATSAQATRSRLARMEELTLAHSKCWNDHDWTLRPPSPGQSSSLQFIEVKCNARYDCRRQAVLDRTALSLEFADLRLVESSCTVARGNRLLWGGLRLVESFLPTCQRLTALDLSSNDLGVYGLKALVEVINT
jgi:hypothetical protein